MMKAGVLLLLVAMGFHDSVARLTKRFVPYSYGPITAVAHIRPDTVTKFPEKVTGTVYVSQESEFDHTRFRVVLSGFTPNSVHGFHIHEYGDIVTNGCRSAGGHYNPFQRQHGGPEDNNRHVGDLGNLRADSKGRLDIRFTDRLVELFGEHSVYGRAFVVHQRVDDLGRGKGAAAAESRITGNAGARLACGVIIHAPSAATKRALHQKKHISKGRYLP